mmetsp:Transcript_10216/g.16341  ORF Transcript_10216/g.16341 Transcript_10216/m.16341 type:complete len:204 (+) Transcript_10216:198-809(+)
MASAAAVANSSGASRPSLEKSDIRNDPATPSRNSGRTQAASKASRSLEHSARTEAWGIVAIFFPSFSRQYPAGFDPGELHFAAATAASHRRRVTVATRNLMKVLYSATSMLPSQSASNASKSLARVETLMRSSRCACTAAAAMGANSSTVSRPRMFTSASMKPPTTASENAEECSSTRTPSRSRMHRRFASGCSSVVTNSTSA